MSTSNCQPNATWENWGKNLTAHPEFLCAPTSKDELTTIVNNAKNLGKKIRVLGGGYSWTPMVPTDDYMIDMSKFNQIISVDQTKKQVTVQAGMRVGDLSLAIGGQPRYLDETPINPPVVTPDTALSLMTETVIPWITVGGAVALGCHGTGYNQGTVSDLVVGMEMLLADGTWRTFSVENDSEDLMNFLRVGLGSLGIIYSVTFQCVPQFNVMAVDARGDMKTTIAGIKDLVTTHDYVEVFWFPFNSKCWIKTWDAVDPKKVPATEGETKWGWDELKVYLEINSFGDWMMNQLQKESWLTPYVLRFISSLMPEQKVVVPSCLAFHYQLYYMPVWDMSYCINIPNNDFTNVQTAWWDVVNRIEALAKQGQYPQNMVLHTRYIKNSSAYLSPASGTDHTCCIEILTYTGDNRPVSSYEDYFKAVEQDWIKLGGKPHWGKAIYSVSDLKTMYGQNMAKFLQVRQNIDPQGMFLNDFLKQVFQIS